MTRYKILMDGKPVEIREIENKFVAIIPAENQQDYPFYGIAFYAALLVFVDTGRVTIEPVS